MRLAVVSPHRDDAAFSCALTMLDWMARGGSVMLVNCFTVSEYAPYAAFSGAEQSRTEAVTALRRAEDAAFLKMLENLGARYAQCDEVDLGWLDAPLRLGLPIDGVCGARAGCVTYEAQVEELARALERLPGFDRALIPLGIGRHIDHELARDAAVRAWGDRACSFYEDLPYAAREPQAMWEIEIENAARLCRRALHPTFLKAEDGTAWKVRCVASYASQVAEEVRNQIAAYTAALGGRERLWAADGW